MADADVCDDSSTRTRPRRPARLARRGAVAASVIAATALAWAAPAAAVPPGLEKAGPDVFECDGDELAVFGGSGRSGWVEDTLYVAREFHVTGEFQPAGGGDPIPLEEHKVYGGGPPGESISCEQHIEESDETGTVIVHVSVVAVPVPGH